jgi:hypothetical protein
MVAVSVWSGERKSTGRSSRLTPTINLLAADNQLLGVATLREIETRTSSSGPMQLRLVDGTVRNPLVCRDGT